MKIIGEPESYSDMLERIFVTTLVTGVLCTVGLSLASPAVKRLLDAVSSEAELGPLKGIKALYVAVPLLIAFLSRMLKLHDRISDALGIREHFDTRIILLRLAEGVAWKDTKKLLPRLLLSRHPAMYATFYKYAGFKEPVIDAQLVRSALDSWGWFWVLLESLFLVLITAGLFALMATSDWRERALYVAAAELVALIGLWARCKRCARAEVDAILQDPARKQAIFSYFQTLGV